MIYTDITKTIGKTPLVEVYRDEHGTTILAKLEYFNPGGSVKDRIALSMIEDGEKKGLIDKDTVIIEPTSGNTGIGLAMVCAAKKYKLILCMPSGMSIERRKILEAYGAELVLVEEGGMKGSIDRAKELSEQYKKSYIPMQFANPANPEAHRKNTAIEILEDTAGKIDVFVSGIGTGETITGTSEILLSANHDIKIVAVEPAGSAVLSGEEKGSHMIQGIGAGFIPDVLNTDVFSSIRKVTNEESKEASRELARRNGIFVGISSGAAMHAALMEAKNAENHGKQIVVLLPDTGERYLSTYLME